MNVCWSLSTMGLYSDSLVIIVLIKGEFIFDDMLDMLVELVEYFGV